MSSSQQLSNTFKLPMLPGNSCGAELLRTNFRKTQHFKSDSETVILKKDIPVDFDATNPVVRSPLATMTSTTSDPSQTLNRQVLRFFGYFKEGVHESPQERERVRKVVLCYFLEDDTISVSEPKQDNSGIPSQGVLVKRHQIQGITFDQLAIGSDVSFYGRTFRLVDADAFTRTFLAGIGINVPAEAEPYPSDNYNDLRSKPRGPKRQPLEGGAGDTNAQGVKIKLGKTEIRATKQFLKNDRMVLRFEAYWDNTANLYGEMRFFKIFYFLSDDTIEVTEKNSANCGRDPFPSFVRRQKCPKPRNGAAKFVNHNASLAFDKGDSQLGAEAASSGSNFYTDSDLTIGADLFLFGRHFIIFDCDAYTRTYLAELHGVSEDQLQPIPVEREPKKKEFAREPPPHTGFGSEEDSLVSWKHLVCNAPKKDATRFMESNNEMLKFTLKLENCDPTDEIRRFVLTYYLIDDTISIFEPVKRNSGIIGGKFLQRQKVKNAATGQYFTSKDFFVGARHVINGFKFYVESTDERSLRYVEGKSEDYPVANIDAIVCKMQAMLLSSSSGLRDQFLAADKNGNGSLDFDEFCGLFEALNLPVNKHEVLTVMRYFDENGDGSITYQELANKIVPPGTAQTLGVDTRQSWEDIHSRLQGESEQLDQTKSALDAAEAHKVATKAAYGARALLECYKGRPTLFNTTFKFAMDFSGDNKVGEAEFKQVLVEKLQLVEPGTLPSVGKMTTDQLACLCSRIFTRTTRRLDLNELIKVLNGTSNHADQNVQTIVQKRSATRS